MADLQTPAPIYPKWLSAIAGVVIGIILAIAGIFIALNFLSDQALPFFEERLPRFVELIEARTVRDLTSKGFVYYEEDGSGALTDSGRFRLAVGEGIPPIQDLEPGTLLVAEDEVYIRKSAEQTGPIVGLVRGGDCVRVNSIGRVLSSAERGNAASAGWLDIALSMCGTGAR